MSTQKVQDYMAGSTSSIKGVLVDFPAPILPKIGGELTRGSLIDLHWSVSENEDFVASNIERGRQGHLTLTITNEE